jgi:protein-L-isoaspartate(D-aspartate) O-methyltransferase
MQMSRSKFMGRACWSGARLQTLRFLGACRTKAPDCAGLRGEERMTDFVEARRMMVEGQVRTYDVTDLRVLAAMLEVPREYFVPDEEQALAYVDQDLTVARAKDGRAPRYLLKPAVLARLIQEAEVAASDRALDVGCATGYSSAVLSKLARSVVALEEDSELASIAREKLARLGATNVTVVTGPLTAGAPSQAPFDFILLNGATEILPQTLCRQLKPGGRLACVFGRAPGRATVYRSVSGHVTGHPAFDAAAPLLPGFAKPPDFVF